MKFELNGMNYTIYTIPNEELVERHKEDFPNDTDETQLHYGYCSYAKHKIYINSYLDKGEQRRTLIHELTHCWLWNTSSYLDGYDNEFVCNVVADSHNFINKILKEYDKIKGK